MKTIILGDTHGRSQWKLIVEMEKPDQVIFIGDYFDSYDLTAVEQMHNFKEIINYKETTNAHVIMLIGNHDYHYYPEIGNVGTSGYQHTAAPAISQLIDENRNHLQMAYSIDDYLFTHAGVSSAFMDNVFGKDGWKTEDISALVTELFWHKPRTFDFGMAVNMDKMWYLDPSGDNQEQSPIWIRPKSLMAVNRDTLRKQVIQIVGHTQMNQLDVEGSQKWTGGRYYFIDTLDTSGEYLIIEDGVIKSNTWKSKTK
jgi:hypothetical protein